MLIEVWERLRGYHKWAETQAVLESANVEKDATGPFDNLSAETLSWNDRTGQKHSAKFTVPDDSPLFKLAPGESVTIRYNPAAPAQFYLRELLRSRVHFIFRTILFWIFIIFVFALVIMFNSLRHHYRHSLW
jgi:hypothetical protein